MNPGTIEWPLNANGEADALPEPEIRPKPDPAGPAPERISTMRPASMIKVPGLRIRSGRTKSAPDRTIIRVWDPASAGCSRRSLVPLPVGLGVKLPALERQCRARLVVGLEEDAVDALDE